MRSSASSWLEVVSSARLLKISGTLGSFITSTEVSPEVQISSATFLVIFWPDSRMTSPALSLLDG